MNSKNIGMQCSPAVLFIRINELIDQISHILIRNYEKVYFNPVGDLIHYFFLLLQWGYHGDE